MKKQRIYISGPMTSSDSEEQARNVQAFHDCATLLRASGCRPVNPANVWPCKYPRIYRLLKRVLGEDGAYRTVLVYDLWLLSRSDTICMIDGWQLSRGAKIEEGFAFRLGIVRSHTYDPKQQKLMPFQKGKKKRKFDDLQLVREAAATVTDLSEAAAAFAALGRSMSRMDGNNKKNELKRNK